jgi:hypothetical protein
MPIQDVCHYTKAQFTLQGHCQTTYNQQQVDCALWVDQYQETSNGCDRGFCIRKNYGMATKQPLPTVCDITTIRSYLHRATEELLV